MAILATVFYLSPRGTSISVCPVPDSTTPSTPFHHFVAPRLASAPSTAVTHFTPLPPALWLCFPAVAQRLPPPAVPESSLSSPRHSSLSLSLSPQRARLQHCGHRRIAIESAGTEGGGRRRCRSSARGRQWRGGSCWRSLCSSSCCSSVSRCYLAVLECRGSSVARL